MCHKGCRALLYNKIKTNWGPMTNFIWSNWNSTYILFHFFAFNCVVVLLVVYRSVSCPCSFTCLHLFWLVITTAASHVLITFWCVYSSMVSLLVYAKNYDSCSQQSQWIFLWVSWVKFIQQMCSCSFKSPSPHISLNYWDWL